MFAISLLSLFAAVAPALAFDPYPKLTSCPVPENTLALPANATAALGAPPPTPIYVGLSLGTNNYTCNTTSNTWTNVGVVSVLFDVSCLVTTPSFPTLQEAAWQAWNGAPKSFTLDKYIKQLSKRPADTKYPLVLATHSFVTDPSYGPAIYPAFDFSQFTHNPADKVTLVKVAAYADQFPEDVPWLQVNRIAGNNLVSKIFRVMTKGGMPPASCKAGDKEMTVRYSGTYWFYA
jgi:hypothetical protein